MNGYEFSPTQKSKTRKKLSLFSDFSQLKGNWCRFFVYNDGSVLLMALSKVERHKTLPLQSYPWKKNGKRKKSRLFNKPAILSTHYQTYPSILVISETVVNSATLYLLVELRLSSNPYPFFVWFSCVSSTFHSTLIDAIFSLTPQSITSFGTTFILHSNSLFNPPLSLN